MLNSLVFCRALDEMRRVFRFPRDGFRIVRFLAFILSVPLSVGVMWQLYHALTAFVRSHLRDLGGSAFGPLAAGTAAVGFLVIMGAGSELFREIGNSKDHDLLQVCPVRPARIAAYRVVTALARTAPFSLALVLYPYYYIWSFWSSIQALILLLLVSCFFGWGVVFALCAAVSLLTMRASCLPRHATLLIFNVALVLISFLVFYPLFDRDGWSGTMHRLNIRQPSVVILLLLLLFFVLSAWMMLRRVLRLWPRIRQEASSVRPKAFLPREPSLFSISNHWAIFQKDFKDLARNPVYKISLAMALLLFPMVLWSQWKAGAGSPTSWRRMMACLSFLYLVPFMVSARTVSLELRMLGFYRLVLSKLARILDLKWRAQSILNCLAVAALSLPYFLFIRPGPRPWEPLYFAVCVVAYVPLFTMLAIALGALFPVSSAGANPIGMNKWGIVIYMMLAVPLYSFLLNYMIAGILIFSVFLIAATLLLYFGARRYLSVLYGTKGA